jgi:hypothetical protein
MDGTCPHCKRTCLLTDYCSICGELGLIFFFVVFLFFFLFFCFSLAWLARACGCGCCLPFVSIKRLSSIHKVLKPDSRRASVSTPNKKGDSNDSHSFRSGETSGAKSIVDETRVLFFFSFLFFRAVAASALPFLL